MTFLIQAIEKLIENGYKNEIKDNAMLEYRLQRQDYVLNERTKDSPIEKVFPSLPRYGQQLIETGTRSKINNQDLSNDNEIFFKSKATWRL